MTDAFSATETHVPRAWYDSQRAALVRAEGQVVALTARCVELHEALEAKSVKREAVREPAPASTPARKREVRAAEVEITF